jgi:hypothetical protein
MDHGMDHGSHSGTGSASIDAAALIVRLIVLLATGFVAGAGLLRPFADSVPARLRGAAWVSGAASAVLAGVSVAALDVNWVAGTVHALLALTIPALFGKPSVVRWLGGALALLVVLETAAGGSGIEFTADTIYVGAAIVWFGFALFSLTTSLRPGLRQGPLALTLALLLLAAGAVQVATSGIALDRRLYETGYGLALLAVVVLPLAVTVLAAVTSEPRRTYRFGALGVAGAFLAWSTVAALPQPPEPPVPGVPLLASADLGGRQVPLLVSPQRPGKNLVHVPDGTPDGTTVGVEDGPRVPLTSRPGADGRWAEVDLPPGRHDLVLGAGENTSAVEVDAGHQAGPATAAGPDSTECASAALGGLLGGHKETLSACPADRLEPQDEESLRGLVGYLADRHVPALTLVQDTAPRSVAAAAAVRDEAARRGVPVRTDTTADSALVSVAGWAGSFDRMRQVATAQQERPTHAFGIYLAPWLLTEPIATSVVTASLPLKFDPRDQQAVGYTVALDSGFGGESPSVGGFRAWLGNDQPSPEGRPQIYAVAQVNPMPMGPDEAMGPGTDMPGHGPGFWIPDATVVPVSPPLDGGR